MRSARSESDPERRSRVDLTECRVKERLVERVDQIHLCGGHVQIARVDQASIAAPTQLLLKLCEQ